MRKTIVSWKGREDSNSLQAYVPLLGNAKRCGSYDHSATNEEGILLAHFDPAWYGCKTCTQTEDCEAQSDPETTDILRVFLARVFLAKSTATCYSKNRF